MCGGCVGAPAPKNHSFTVRQHECAHTCDQPLVVNRLKAESHVWSHCTSLTSFLKRRRNIEETCDHSLIRFFFFSFIRKWERDCTARRWCATSLRPYNLIFFFLLRDVHNVTGDIIRLHGVCRHIRLLMLRKRYEALRGAIQPALHSYDFIVRAGCCVWRHCASRRSSTILWPFRRMAD